MKYTKETVKEICDNLKLGLTIKDVCEYVGINPDTFFDWQKNKPDFSDRIKRAQMECKRRCISIIHRASINSWQASAWWLERRHADEYQMKNKTELTGAGGKSIEFSVKYVK